MIEFAVVVGLGYVTIFLFVVSCLVAGWRRSGMGLLALLVSGVVLLALWLLFIVGISPLDPSAMMAQVSLILGGIGAFLIGHLISRLLRKSDRADSPPESSDLT
ncbi:MAG: hypothetical protein ABJI96_05290 [Paracoccaceae bacterium]